jgi:hypothetical protein
MESQYFHTKPAAKYCGLSPRFLEKLRALGDGPRFIRVSGHRFICYAREDLDSWLRAGRRDTGAESFDTSAPQDCS